MNIFIGRTIIATLVATATIPLYAEVIYQDDFESAIPGKAPSSWKQVWGMQGNDTFKISGEKSVSGNNSLQYERNDSNTPWQTAIIFPRIQSGIVHISFNFSLRGQKNDAKYRIILRRNNVNIIDLRLAAGAVSATVFKEQLDLKDVSVEQDKWYHLEFNFPLSPADGNEFSISMTDPSDGKKQLLKAGWQPEDKPSSIILLCDFSGKVKSTSLFFDDFKIESVSAKTK